VPHETTIFQEEYKLGKCFSQQNYDDTYVGPTWQQLIKLLAEKNVNDMYILFCGVVGSQTNHIGGSGFGLVTRTDVQQVSINLWDEHGGPAAGKLIPLISDPDNTPWCAHDLLHMGEFPQHVTGIVVRKIR
jgi:hypothetical protein